MEFETKHPETLALHAGFRSDPATNATAVPIYQSSSFLFESSENAADFFSPTEVAKIYNRMVNPTTRVLEERVAAIDGGAAGLALASGQAAAFIAIRNICRAGDNIVASSELYDGTWSLFINTLPAMGIEVRYVKPSDPVGFARATDERTRCFFAETLPTSTLEPFPIAEVAKVGQSLGVPLIVDNTACPVICRPLDHGAAIVLYTSTMYLGGHGTTVGGMIVDGGTFDWDAHANRFPTIARPDENYFDVIWTKATEALGPIAFSVKARFTLMPDHGAQLSPFNAFMFIQGIETLPLRMREHCRNAWAVAEFLANHPKVEQVVFPSFMEGDAKKRAEKYLHEGQCPLVSFVIEGGKDVGRRFMDNLKMFYHVANIGDTRSLALHPSTTTYFNMTSDEQLETGLDEGYLRLSVGLEHIDDIVGDLQQALAASAGRFG